MQIPLLWITVVMSVVTFAVHTFIGGIKVAAPLLTDTNLPIASKWLNYYCWHVTTVYTFAMGGAYAYSAINPQSVELVVFLSILNAAFSLLSAAVALKAKINPFRFPSTSLFAAVSILGISSLLVSN